jgi:hypothetical protein
MLKKRFVLLLTLAACGGDQAETEQASPTDAGLEAMVDSVMPRLQVLAGLQKRGDIQMRMQNKDSLRKYIEQRMAEEMPAQELAGVKAVYVTLGVMPADLDLQRLLLDLYTEQVVGYYDPDSKALFVVEGADRETVRPVLVHELVHALQDQHTNLDSLIAKDRGNDRQTAAQSAIEGHATMVMVAYLAEAQAKSPVDPRVLPDIGQSIRPSLEAQNAQFPVFQRAPRILREALLFPYASGAGFVQKLWLRPLNSGFGDPYPAPIGDLMPSSTEQVMHPDSRFLVERDEPTELRLAAATGPVIRENSLGEMEISVFLGEHLGADAERQSAGWDGDRYRLIKHGNGNVLIWYSVWDDNAAADRFADAYRRIATKRSRSARVERITVEGRPVVRVVDPDPGVDLTGVAVPDVSIAR